MNGTGGMPDGGGFPGGFTGAADTSAALLSSSSNLNSTSVVSGANGTSTVAPQTGMGGFDGTEPPAKRIKVEPTAPFVGNSSAVNNMAAIAANRATVGVGITPEQFIQSLQQGYAMNANAITANATNATPAYMVMLQQQQLQQAHQHQVQQHQQQQQQLQMQRHLHLQRQAQIQQQLQGTNVQYMQQNPHTAAAAAQMQAQAIMMAALTQNQLANMAQSQPLQTHQSVYNRYVNQPAVPAATVQSTLLPVKKPQPSDDPSCLICHEKGEGLFLCSYACGLTVHPRCLGEDKIFTTEKGAKACGNCFLTHQDRITRENLHTGGANGISVRRAILALNEDTTKQEDFEKFGHLTSLRLYEIAQIAGYPITPFAMRSAEQHLQRWIREKLCLVGTSPLTVRDVFTVVIGLYSLDRVKVSHCWRDKFIELVKAKNYQATDYLGWHPVIEGPNVRCSSLCSGCSLRNQPEALICVQCRRALVFPSIFSKFNSALLAAYYADNVGVSFGATFLETFAHTHALRSHYKGLKPFDPNGYEWDLFVDQMRAIFGLLDIASDFGVLELDPDLFEPEVKFIFEPQYLNQAMVSFDFELVGRFVQGLKQFGQELAVKYAETIKVCEHYLLSRQTQLGGWCKSTGSNVDRYKATAACAKGLLNPVYRGRGPVNSDVHRLLVKWAKKTPGNAHAKRVEQLGSGKLLLAGVTLNGRSVPNLKRLEVFYRRQIVPSSGQNPLETLATARLQAIWKRKPSEPVDSNAKDEASAAVTDNEDTDSISMKTEPSVSAEGEGLEGEGMSVAQQYEDESLTNLSLSGELSLFDGLKFEDGDVIDIGTNESGDAADDEDKGDSADATDEGDDDEQRDEEIEETPSDDQDGEDDAPIDDAENGMYDDDDDGDEDSQLPEPELMSEMGVDTSDGAMGTNGDDLGDLDVGIALDDEFGQGSMDLGIDL